LQSQLAGRSGDAEFSSAAAELLSVSALFAGDKSLRVAVADAGQSVNARQQLVRDLFGSRINSLALDVLVNVAGARWSDAEDVAEALEALAAHIIFATAQAAGELDRVEEELFLFGRAVDANPELQMALTNPALNGAAKSAVVRDVLAGRAAKGSETLLIHTAANLRGRRVDAAIKTLSDLAASQRERVVAQVRVAIPLTQDQASRLANVLGRIAGRQVSLNVVVDSSVIGGVSVRLGDDVIDGSIKTRLEQARRAIVG
jgi:F-type H+-transporting ATPase subunit delta